LGEVFVSALECLFAKHRAPVAFHGGIVRSEKLSRDHPFKLIFWSNPNERS
jgi:hypothetical protein